MTRTSMALKRLGVAGLAVVTIGAGVPAFFVSTASASGPVTTVTQTAPAGLQGAAGSCIPFQAEVKDQTGVVVPGATVTVQITDQSASATQDVAFCTLPTTVGGTTYQPQTGTPTATQGPVAGGGGSDTATFVTNSDGVATYGVTSREPANVLVRAFYDANNDKTFSAGEPTDTDTATFTQGGPAGGNANQDAANSVTVAPTADNAVVGETRNFLVTVLNASGDEMNGVIVFYATTPPGVGQAQTYPPTSCGATDNNGVATCKVPFTAAGTDNLTFYVNQTGGAGSGPDVGEPQDNATVTVTAAPTQGAQTLVLSCQADPASTFNSTSPCVNSVNDTTRIIRAVVDNSSASNTTTTVGVRLSFTVSGGSGDETVAPVECTTTDYTPGAGDATADAENSFCDVTVTDPTPVPGEVLTVTGSIRGTTTKATATVTFRNEPNDARNISLTPETATTPPNSARTFTATVLDSLGKTVQGVAVTFTETGAGAFRNGSSTVTGTTDANGQASVEVISLPGETGTQTITVSIDTPAGTECQRTSGSGADPGFTPTGGAVPAGQTAGNCTDSSTNTFANASPTPTPSTSTSPATKRPVMSTSTPDIQPNIQGILTATNLDPNTAYELRCYSRPSTTYFTARSATTSAAGSSLEFRILPGTNTRCYVRPAGNEGLASNSVVINVHTTLSLSTVRTGVRTYIFQGRNLPRRSGHLITLYRIAGGQEIRTANLITDASGIYRITRTFTGTGTFQFRVRSGQNLTNAAGASNIITVRIF